MKLLTARLCLDCDEIHSSSTCPKCASNAFSLISKWLDPAQRHLENAFFLNGMTSKKGVHIGHSR